MPRPPRHDKNKAIENIKKWPQQEVVLHNYGSTRIVKTPKSCEEMLFDQKMAQLCEYFLEASVYAVAYFNAFHKSVDLQLILLFTMQFNYFEEVASLRLVNISSIRPHWPARFWILCDI